MTTRCPICEQAADTHSLIDGQPICAAVRNVAARVGQALRDQAQERFAQYGPHDARGAAFWDASWFIEDEWAGNIASHGGVRV